jgi:hypothetical protein
MARIKRIKKSDVLFMESAIKKWFALPEAQGFGRVQKADMMPPWDKGPRVMTELSTITEGEFDKLLFYFRKKTLGYQVVAVWTVKPRERIWATEDPTISQ